MTPEGWRQLALSEAAEVNPARFLERGTSAPFIEMAAVHEESPRVRYLLKRSFDGGGARFTNGDTLLARITPCAENGKTALVTQLASNATVAFGSTEFIVLAPRDRLSIPEFIYFTAKRESVRSVLVSRMVGTSGRQRIPNSALDEIVIGVPPLPEQRKIAAILSSVDGAIEASQAVIDQIQVVKKAMMAELLTKGLPGRHKKFKQTEIGQMPLEWMVCTIDSLGMNAEATVRSGPFGSSMKTKDFVASGVPVLTIQSLGHGELLREGLFYVSNEKARELAEYKVRPNDVVFSRVADIGRCAAISREEDGWLISPNLSRIRLDPGKTDARFLMYLITIGASVLRQVEMVAGNAGRPVISSTTLKELRLPVPELPEQHAIAAAGQELEQRLTAERQYLIQLQDTKFALMSVLLTGEVRVRVDEDAAA